MHNFYCVKRLTKYFTHIVLIPLKRFFCKKNKIKIIQCLEFSIKFRLNVNHALQDSFRNFTPNKKNRRFSNFSNKIISKITYFKINMLLSKVPFGPRIFWRKNEKNWKKKNWEVMFGYWTWQIYLKNFQVTE